MRASLDAGRCVTLDSVATMADGIAVRCVSDLTLAHAQAYVHDVVTVTEEEISQALLLLAERAKVVVEPAGAVSLAAILAGRVPGTGPALAVLSDAIAFRAFPDAAGALRMVRERGLATAVVSNGDCSLPGALRSAGIEMGVVVDSATGGAAKCDYVTRELGFDACVDYKVGRVFEDLRTACPTGVDVCFENVGGAILDTTLRLMNRFSRVVVCGLIAEYNVVQPYGYTRLRSVLVNRIKMQGMIVFDWKDRYAEAREALTRLVLDGKLKYRESVIDGLENAPRGMIALLKGENFGKQLVRLA